MFSSPRLRSGIAATAAAATLVGGIVVVSAPGAGAGTGTGTAVEQQDRWYQETTTAVQASPTSAPQGSRILLTAEVVAMPFETGDVDAAAPPPPPSGTVTFGEGDTTLGQGELAEDGTATFSTEALSVGVHVIDAAYSGDEFREPSTSTSVEVTITALPVTTAPPAPAPPAGTYTTSGGTPSNSLTVTPRGGIPVSGTGWQAGTEIEIWMHSDPVLLGTVVAGPDGSFSTRYAVPASAPLGAHEIVMSGIAANGEPATVRLALSIVAGAVAPAATPSTLAFTG